ncbi:hypothetical protein M8J75_012007 [Diaphorina citri]|nr:hypothetical protein M8J75_012007 [Diaphorina citri]
MKNQAPGIIQQPCADSCQGVQRIFCYQRNGLITTDLAPVYSTMNSVDCCVLPNEVLECPTVPIMSPLNIDTTSKVPLE